MAFIWDIEKYARYYPNTNQVQKSMSSGEKGEWKHYEDKDSHLKLAILKNHMLLSGRSNVLESFSLLDSANCVRGVRKGDSMLFLYKIDDESRKFRIKFKSSSEKGAFSACSECYEHLSRYFPWKSLEPDINISSQMMFSQTQFSQTTNMSTQSIPLHSTLLAPNCIKQNNAELEGTHPISEIAQILLNKNPALPDVYNYSNYPTDQVNYHLQLCLTDPNFPAFVQKVHDEFKILTKNVYAHEP